MIALVRVWEQTIPKTEGDPPDSPNLLLHVSFVIIELERNCSHLIDLLGSYSYPCLPQGLRRKICSPWHQVVL
jgi:hypothetical protein